MSFALRLNSLVSNSKMPFICTTNFWCGEKSKIAEVTGSLHITVRNASLSITSNNKE